MIKNRGGQCSGYLSYFFPEFSFVTTACSSSFVASYLLTCIYCVYIIQYSYRTYGSVFHFHAHAFKGGAGELTAKKLKRRSPAVEAFSAQEEILCGKVLDNHYKAFISIIILQPLKCHYRSKRQLLFQVEQNLIRKDTIDMSDG